MEASPIQFCLILKIKARKVLEESQLQAREQPLLQTLDLTVLTNQPSFRVQQ